MGGELQHKMTEGCLEDLPFYSPLVSRLLTPAVSTKIWIRSPYQTVWLRSMCLKALLGFGAVSQASSIHISIQTLSNMVHFQEEPCIWRGCHEEKEILSPFFLYGNVAGAGGNGGHFLQAMI